MTSFKLSGPEEDIEIIRQVYSGINCNDIDFVLNLMDVDITRIAGWQNFIPLRTTKRLLNGLGSRLMTD